MNVAGATVAMLGGDEGEAIPAPVLDEEILRQTRRDVYILDLASTPGGVDFNPQRNWNGRRCWPRGCRGKWLRSAPGKY